jgi:hypothetical protein
MHLVRLLQWGIGRSQGLQLHGTIQIYIYTSRGTQTLGPSVAAVQSRMRRRWRNNCHRLVRRNTGRPTSEQQIKQVFVVSWV